jgi:hypothetical protein
MPKTLPTSLPEVSILRSPLSFSYSFHHQYPQPTLFTPPTPVKLRQTALLASHPPYTPTRFPSQLQTRPVAAQLPVHSRQDTPIHPIPPIRLYRAIAQCSPAAAFRQPAAAEASLLQDCARALLAACQITKTNPIDLPLSSETCKQAIWRGLFVRSPPIQSTCRRCCSCFSAAVKTRNINPHHQ